MALDPSYLQVSDGTGDASLMHITADRLIGSTTIVVDTLIGVPPKFIAASGTLNSQGFIDPATVTNFYGQIVSGHLQIDGFCAGSADAGNTTGQVVVIKPNTSWANMVANFFNRLYPVGSVYTNASVATNPGTLLGFGTWIAFGVGRVMVGIDPGQTEFNTLGETGGEKNHTLSSGEMPSHNHGVTDPGHNHVQRGSGGSLSGGSIRPAGGDPSATSSMDMLNNTTGITINSTGGGAAHNNLQPYIVVYMWIRTV